MNKKKHTPGPWVVWKGHFDVYAGVIENTRAVLTGEKGKKMPRVACCEDDLDLTKTEMTANARLIAAAPDLLAACERFVKNGVCTCTDGGVGFVCDVCEARAALAKARAGT